MCHMSVFCNSANDVMLLSVQIVDLCCTLSQNYLYFSTCASGKNGIKESRQGLFSPTVTKGQWCRWVDWVSCHPSSVSSLPG